MKDLEFNDYTATYEDNDGDEHQSTVRAAVVDKDSAFVTQTNADNSKSRVPREVNTPAGRRSVQPGDALVETETPGVYDYLSADAWKRTGYAQTAQKRSQKGSQRSSSTPQEKAETPADDKSDESDTSAKRKLPGDDDKS